MSVEAVAIAMHHSRAKGSARLVLWGIANHDGDGGSWPSVATLARYAGIDPRNAQKALARLEQLGEIRRIVQAGGTHRTADYRRPNLYEFRLKCPPGCDGTKRHRVKNEPVALELDVQLTDGEWLLNDDGGLITITDEGVTEAPPLSYPQSSTGVTEAPGDRVTEAPGELTHLEHHDSPSTDQPQTTRARVTDPQLLASMTPQERLDHDLEHDRQRLYRRRCRDGSQLHYFIDASSDWCELCGIHRYRDERKNWNTGERRSI